MDIRKRVGVNLRHFRKKREVSQEKLAEDCGLHRTDVSGVERGIRNPSVLILAKIAKAVDIPPARLLDERKASRS